MAEALLFARQEGPAFQGSLGPDRQDGRSVMLRHRLTIGALTAAFALSVAPAALARQAGSRPNPSSGGGGGGGGASSGTAVPRGGGGESSGGGSTSSTSSAGSRSSGSSSGSSGDSGS